jgi:hypothetical protein
MPPVPFIFLRHYCTETRVDLFCFLDAAKFFWTTIELAPSPVPDCPALSWRAVAFSAGGDGGRSLGVRMLVSAARSW